MTVVVLLAAAWLGSGAWFLYLCLKGEPPAPVVSRELSEAIEVGSLEFSLALPSYREGIHNEGC